MEQDENTATSTMNDGKQGNGNGFKIATVIASIIAVCGIGFGVYGMVQSSQKDNQISDLKIQVEDSNGKVTALETDEIKISESSQTITISDSAIKKQNPVISAVAPKKYSLFFGGSWGDRSLNLYVQDGGVTECYINSGGKMEKNCSIVGITGKIYKVVEIGEGQAAIDDKVAFIMEDGSVEYLSLIDALEKDDFNIRGKLKIDGFVVDAIHAGVGFEDVSVGYGTTIFVLSDGSYIQYEPSMLN